MAILLDLRQVLFDLLLAHIVFPLKAGFSKGLLFRFAPVRVYQQLKKVKNWNFIKIFEGFEETEQSGESNSHLILKALIKNVILRGSVQISKGFIDKFERKPGAHFSRKVGAKKWRQNLVKMASKYA